MGRSSRVVSRSTRYELPSTHKLRTRRCDYCNTQAQCIANLGNVLKAAGSSWERVVKVNVYLKNMDDFVAMNEVYEKREYFTLITPTQIKNLIGCPVLPSPKPARTCISALRLPNDVDVEIEAIATY